MVNLEQTYQAQASVIGSMLIDEQCVPLVISQLRPEDFLDSTFRATFAAIRKLSLEGRPVDPVTVVDAMQGGAQYVGKLREAMENTPTAANVGEYIPMVREAAAVRRVLDLSETLPELASDHEAFAAQVLKMASELSVAERAPRMTAAERAADFYRRMTSKEKPRYLPWGIPTADRCVYAELGDMILLGGNASAGKTLLSILMATAQAKAGYRVGYYSLETSPEKMTDRQVAALSGVELWKIKLKRFSEMEWQKFAAAESFLASEAPFDVIDASGLTVDDIAADAVGHRYQVIYVDYVQNLAVSGIRKSDGYARVTAVSQGLKTFARRTGTAVVALAQLSRPSGEKGGGKEPTMYSFKESGQLEQDADAAFLIYPVDKDDTSSNRMFCIAKNKEGARPKPVELVFRGETQTMMELAPEEDRTMAAKLAAGGRASKIANSNAAMRAQFEPVQTRAGENPFAGKK